MTIIFHFCSNFKVCIGKSRLIKRSAIAKYNIGSYAISTNNLPTQKSKQGLRLNVNVENLLRNWKNVKSILHDSRDECIEGDYARCFSVHSFNVRKVRSRSLQEKKKLSQKAATGSNRIS